MKKHWKLLILLFILSLSFRLFFTFQTPTFSDTDTYYAIRQIENIHETGLPLFNDPLSYGGKNQVFVPLYYYLLAIFSFVMPLLLALKIIPAIFASLLVFATYLLAKELTKNSEAATFSAFLSAFIPIVIEETVNTASIFSLILPGTVFLMYYIIRLYTYPSSQKNATRFLVLFFFLGLASSYTLIIVMALLFYLLLLKTEDIKVTRAETELVLFSTFVFFWILIIVYKKAFFIHGPGIIWQNIPTAVLKNYFKNINILTAVYQIGIIPLVFGAYAIYRNFQLKRKTVFLLSSLTFSLVILLWLRLIEFKAGLVFLGVILAVLFSLFYQRFFIELAKTKFHKYKKHLVLVFILVFFLTAVIPSYSSAKQASLNSITAQEIGALEWINQNTNHNAVILGAPEQGNLITQVAKRKNVLDTRFLLTEDLDPLWNDVHEIYTVRYKTNAIELLDKHDVNYIMFSDFEKRAFEIEEIPYVQDECFELVFDNYVKIYKSLCVMKT